MTWRVVKSLLNAIITIPGNCTKSCEYRYWSFAIERKLDRGKGCVARAFVHASEDNFCELGINGKWSYQYGCARGIELPLHAL
jgi:hypothetical protein